MRAILLALGLCAALPAQDASRAQGAVSRGFEHFYNLEYDQAIAEFQKAVAAAPDVPDLHNHLAQAILYRAMFRAGALESELVTGNNAFLRREKVNPSPEESRQFDESIARAMQLCEARIGANARDAAALYALGVAHGLRANYNFLVRKTWRDSLRDATAARKSCNKVTEIDSTMVDARLVQGVHDYVVGSLPFHYKMLGFLIGFRGDREQGIRTLQIVAEQGRHNRVDAEVLLAAIYRRERRSADAVPLLESLITRYPRNYLFRFELAGMHSELGNKDRALEVLARIEELKSSAAPGYTDLAAEKIYFARGNLQFWYLDLDQAIDNLRKVTRKAEDLDLNTGVLAWMRLGQTYDLKGQRALALEAYRSAVRYAPQSDAGRESRRYLSSPYRREKS